MPSTDSITLTPDLPGTLALSPILATSSAIALAVLGLAALLSAVRMAKGPTLADRVIALDMLGSVVLAAIAVDAVRTGQRELLWVAVAMALLLFVGTLAFAFYMRRHPDA